MAKTAAFFIAKAKVLNKIEIGITFLPRNDADNAAITVIENAAIIYSPHPHSTH